MRLAVFYACIAGADARPRDGTERGPLRLLHAPAARDAVQVPEPVPLDHELRDRGADGIRRRPRPERDPSGVSLAGRAVVLVLLRRRIAGFATFLSPIGFRIGRSMAGRAGRSARPCSGCWRPARARCRRSLLMAALVVELLVLRTPPFRRLIADSSVLFSNRPLFSALRHADDAAGPRLPRAAPRRPRAPAEDGVALPGAGAVRLRGAADEALGLVLRAHAYRGIP